MTQKSRDEIFAELADLELDADALQEMVAAAKITRQARSTEPIAVDDDATTVADTPSPMPPAATNPSAPSPPFATSYANCGRAAAQATLVKDFADAKNEEVADTIQQLCLMEPAERPCFLVCTSHPVARLRVLHGIDVHPPKLLDPSEFDGNAFAFHGDAFATDPPPTYQIEPGWFRREKAISITFSAFEAKLTDPVGDVVDATSSTTKEIRSIALIPTAMAPLLMGKPLTPTAAWPILRAYAQREKLTAQLAPLFNWLLAVSIDANDKCRIDMFTPSDMAPVLFNRRSKIADMILPTATVAPTVIASSTTTPTATDPQTAALRLLAAALSGGIAGAKAPAAPKTPATRWPHQLPALLRVTQAADEAALPAIWWEAAKAKKADFRSVLAVMLNDRAVALKLPAPFASHRVANKVHEQAFAPTNDEDLADGFSPWDFPMLTPADHALLIEQTREWSEHVAGNNNPTIAETRAALRTAKILPIRRYTELFANLAHFEIFMDVCLGPAHTIVADLRYVREYLQDDQLRLERALTADPKLGSQIVTMVRLQVAGFLRTACHSAGHLIIPNLRGMADDLRFGTWVPPRLPHSLLNLLAPQQQQQQRYQPPMYQHQQHQRWQPQQQTYAQPQAQQGYAQNQFQNAPRAQNTNFHTAWRFFPALKPIVDGAKFVQGGTVPHTDEGIPFCLTFQFKGDCRANCTGRTTHRRPTPAEFARLDAWHQRFCRVAPTPQNVASQPTPPSSYVQPNLPREAPRQQQNQRGAPRGGRGGRGSGRSSPITAPPPVPVVVASEDGGDGTSTLGTAPPK